MTSRWDDIDAEAGATSAVNPNGQQPVGDGTEARHLVSTPASRIKMRPVRWLWQGRLAVGTVALWAGREGIGKSTAVYDTAAHVTRGDLPGVHAGRPRSVLVAASEDSWEYTVIARLVAAGADLDRVYRVEIETAEGLPGQLTLPADIHAVEKLAAEVDATMLVLDPLMPRLSASLDTHKDADVRRALEPMAALAVRAGLVLVGIIHVNKSTSTDPLDLVMASKAFVAVARAVLFAMRDPDDEHRFLLGQPKNNLGPLDLPTLTYRIEEAWVAETDEGTITTARVVWGDDSERDVRDALEAASRGETQSAVEEATEWLAERLDSRGGAERSKAAKAAGRAAGHTDRTLQRARVRLKVSDEGIGFPRETWWLLPGAELSEKRQDGDR